MNNLLSVSDLSVAFRLEDRSELEVIKNISFAVGENEVLAIVGESGSGKSVASLAIMGLLQPEVSRIKSGKIEFAGQDLLLLNSEQRRKIRGSQMSMIFQDPMSSLNPVFKIKNQILETLILHSQLRGNEAIERVYQLLGEVGMKDPLRVAESYPHQLSGGQQQRVMIAIAIAAKPKLIIADEPTTALDVTIQKQVLELLINLQKSYQLAIIFITHDLGLVREIAHRVVVMRHGVIRETGVVPEIFNAPKDNYTKALLACRPPSTGKPSRLPVISDFINADSSEISQKNNINLSAEKLVEEENLPLKNESLTSVEAPFLQAININTWLGKSSFFSNKKPAHIVKDVSFSIERGQTLGIVGESGSGKTTLGLSLLKLYKASGSVLLEGKEILNLSEQEFMPYRRRIQVIFQNPLASLNPRFTIGQIISEPMIIHRLYNDKSIIKNKALLLLEQVGLPSSAWNRYPHEFSGGQCQRIAIARCLSLNPEILVCDESVSALDVSIQAQILNLLKDLQEQYKLTYLFISHDLNVVRYISHQIMVMNQGQVVETNEADQLFQNPKEQYTKNLLAAIPAIH